MLTGSKFLIVALFALCVGASALWRFEQPNVAFYASLVAAISGGLSGVLFCQEQSSSGDPSMWPALTGWGVMGLSLVPLNQALAKLDVPVKLIFTP